MPQAPSEKTSRDGRRPMPSITPERARQIMSGPRPPAITVPPVNGASW